VKDRWQLLLSVGGEDLENAFLRSGHIVNPLAPSDPYMGRTAQLTYRCCILNTYSTNIRTEYFKRVA
jgi:hypothetical protein